MVDFNKKFIDTKELQSEILKLKNSIISSLTDKDTADAAVVKTDLANIKSSNEEINKSLKGINLKISDLYAKAKESSEKSDKVVALEVKINTDNTRITTRLDDLKREISNVETTSVNAIQIINAANTTSKKELDKKITESNNEITKLKTILLDKNDKLK